MTEKNNSEDLNELENTPKKLSKQKKILMSLGIGLFSFGLVYAGKNLIPLNPTNQAIVETVQSSDTGKSQVKKVPRSENQDKKEEITSKKDSKDIVETVLDQYGKLPALTTQQTKSNANLKLALAETTAIEEKKTTPKLVPTVNQKPTPPKVEVLPPIEKPVVPPTEPEPPIVPPLPPVMESTPVIQIAKGDIVVEKNRPFDLTNYVLVSDSMDDNPIIHFSNMIDVSQSGLQTMTIYVTNKYGNSAQKTLTVYVNSMPELTLKNGATTEIQIDDSDFSLLGSVMAMDEEDGDITGAIQLLSSEVDISKEGSYEAEFKVTDSKGFSSFLRVTYQVTNEAPVIHFDTSIRHEINQLFDPLNGVYVTDREDGNIAVTESMIIKNDVDVTQEGTYHVVYEVKDSHEKSSGEQEQLVTVENEAPVIHGAVDLEFHVGTAISKERLLEGITATDREDDKAGLSLVTTIDDEQYQALLKNLEGEYQLTYHVTDSMGKTATKEITVRLVNDAPVLHGIKESLTLEEGSTFNPLEGVHATDTETPTIEVQVTSKVDTAVLGTYEVTYSATDEQGKQTTQVMVVTVIKKKDEFIAPLDVIVSSSPMGDRVSPTGKGAEFHRGRDFAVPAGTPIKAIAGGTVLVSEFNSSWGEFVVIQHENGYTSLYAHQSERKVSVGQKIGQGDTIGLVGSTGDSTGPHLHVEVSTNSNWGSNDGLIDIATLVDL